MIIDAQSRLGNKWIDVAALLPGRTANSIKNRWNATLLPRLRRQMAPLSASSPSSPLCPIYNSDAAAGQKRCAESSLLDYRLWGKRMCPGPGTSPHASSSGAMAPADNVMGRHDLRSAQWSMLSQLVAHQLQLSAMPVPVLPQLKLLPKAGDERAAAPARVGSTSPSSTENGASASPSPVRTPHDDSGLLPSMRSYISGTCAVDALSQAAPAQQAAPTSQAIEGVLDLHRALLLQQQQQQQRQELELVLHLMLSNKMQAAPTPADSAHSPPQGQALTGAPNDLLQAGPHNNNLNLLLTALMREEQAAQATPGSQAESGLKQQPHLVPA